MLIFFHTLLLIFAIVLALIIWLKPKGTNKHQRLGWLFASCMTLSLLLSFGIQGFGGLSFIHGISCITLLHVLGGVFFVTKKPKGWQSKHVYCFRVACASLVFAGVMVAARHDMLFGLPFPGALASAFGATVLASMWMRRSQGRKTLV
jgi:uncharacterized membrane protein